MFVDEPCDIYKQICRFTMDSIGEIGFGAELNNLHTDHPFCESFDWCNYYTFLRVAIPGFKFSCRYRTFGTLSDEREMDKYTDRDVGAV